MASNREIRFPADSLLALRKALRHQVGGPQAVQVLQEAGHAAGDSLFRRLDQGDGVEATPHAIFWSRLSSLFREMGWGTVDHEELHSGVGSLVARDWFEVDPAATTPSCPFSAGMLANILGHLAGQDVAVMVVPGPDDDRSCRFLFGAGPVLQQVYAELREGRTLETALRDLG
ncbi:MAG: hypothetical protein ACOCUW_03250 [Gemmatimonadota bacterium]